MGDSRERVWFGYQGDNGVAVLDGNTVRTFLPRDGLQVGTVMAIHEHREHVWIGGDNGLALFDGDRIRMLTADGGQTFRGICGLVETADGDLWIYARAGILHIGANEIRRAIDQSGYGMHFEIFDSLDGLSGIPSYYSEPVEVATSDGRLWFAATEMLFRIDPAHLIRNTIPPPVFIRSVDAGGKIYHPLPKLGLPARTTSLHIVYTALSLSVPERVRFRYQLVGVDKGWQDAGTRREAFYTNLAPRQYQFRVVACNNDGLWNEAGGVLNFSIAPTYYQTAWFQAACVAAILALIWALYRYRLRHITAEYNARLQERVAERTRIARDLHDTLLQSFQASVIQMQRARNHLARSPEEAIRTLDNAIGSGEQAIVEGRDAIQDLRPTITPQPNLEHLLTVAGQELAKAQDANGTPPMFRVTVEGPHRSVSPILQDEVYRIGREVLRNAFRHSQASHIEAEIRYDNRKLRLRIRDDGKGIDRDIMAEGARAGHWGLPGARERATRIGGRLDFWSEAGAGTEVELTVPASRAYAKPQARRRFGFFRKRDVL